MLLRSFDVRVLYITALHVYMMPWAMVVLGCRLRDIKNDGKLDWDEFHNNVFDQIRDTEAEEHVRGHDYLQHPSQDIQSQKIVESKAKFAELDKNNDGFLTEDEMVPIMVRLYPSEGSYARQQAEHLLNEVLYYLPFTYSITQTVHFSCFLHIEKQCFTHCNLFSISSRLGGDAD
jgi:hypothetical protein